MAYLPILQIPDKRLREKALPIERVDDSIRTLMDNMYETMTLDDQGVGLSGNQVGVLKRVIVVDLGRDYQKEPLFMANPEIVSLSDDLISIQDGCLSVPDTYAKTNRADNITVQYLDRQNQRQELSASGLLSACLQHEIDHLNGVLFLDHLPAIKRKMILSKLLKKSRKKS